VPITDYKVVSSDGTTIDAGTSTSAMLTGLTPGTTYTFTVTATNRAGLTSAPSAVASVTTPPAGPMSIAPTAIDFGLLALGQTSPPQTVTVTAGGLPLVVTSVSLSGTRPGDFAIQLDLCSGKTVQPGGSCTFAVVYTPTIQASVSALATITDGDPSFPQQVTLTGSSSVPTTAGVMPVRNIQMLDSQHGYFLELGLNNATAMMETTDGGKTWTRLITPADVRIVTGVGFETSFRFVDATHGFALACRPVQPSPTCQHLVISTSDGGQTWTDLPLLPSSLFPTSLWFTDQTHGWVIGGSGTTGLTGIFATSDAGLTWTQQTLADPIASDPNCGLASEGNPTMGFADSMNGWVTVLTICRGATALVGEATVSWSTGDGGANWAVHLLPPNVFVDPQLEVPGASQMRAPAVSVNQTTSPPTSAQVLASSDDSGATFTFPALPGPNLPPFGIEFTDAANGVMLAEDLTVWRTADEGRSWVKVGTLPKFQSQSGPISFIQYVQIEAVDANNLWVVGLGDYFNLPEGLAGFVEHSSDGGATWVVQLLGDGT
jgi:photosystem II stability/assembly factor-like uncharacterized protein